MTLLALSRPFWPLFLHVAATMVLFGAVLAAFACALARLARPAALSLAAAIPAWAVAVGAGHWLQHDEGLASSHATWLQLGRNILEPGVLVLLLAILGSWWWVRSADERAGRATAGFSGIYLVLLAVGWLAMSGKWGS